MNGDEIAATPTRTSATSEIKEGTTAAPSDLSATHKTPPETEEARKEEEKEPELPKKGEGQGEVEESVEEVGGHIYSVVDKCECEHWRSTLFFWCAHISKKLSFSNNLDFPLISWSGDCEMQLLS